MTSVSAVSNNLTASHASRIAAADEAETRFLTLLTAQMKNQDPLNPLDNAAVTSQMAQLSTVTGVNKLNETLAALKTGFEASAGLQASNLIGKTVLAPSDVLDVGSGVTRFGVLTSGPSDTVTVNLLEEDGQVVHTLELGASDGSLIQAQWDGKLADGTAVPPGMYGMQVVAATGDAEAIGVGLTYSKVESVVLSPGGPNLRLADNRNVTVNQVSTIN